MKTKRVFVCGIAWQHEVGETDVKMYPTAVDCAADQRCADDCGVVELEVTEVRWVKEQRPLTSRGK
jgi:hypothetical protein